MNTTHTYQKRVAQISILSGIIALLSIYFTLAGSGFNQQVFEDPTVLLGMTTANVQELKWSMIFDMFGFYLLLAPAVFFFHDYMKKRTAWSHLLSWCGAAYILIGAIGAGILAAVFPAAITEYTIATTAEQQIILRNFQLANQIVYSGMWNIVEVTLAGTWWLGLGIVLKKEDKALGVTTITLGVACILDAVGNMTGWQAMAQLGLNTYLLLGIAWPVWMGIKLYKGLGQKRKRKPSPIIEAYHSDLELA